MPTTLYSVIVDSNAEREFLKGAVAAKAFTKSVENNRVAFQSRDDILKNTIARQSTLKNVMDKLNKITKKSTKSTLANAVAQRIAAKASKTAGLNIGGLSLRISEGLIPVLAIMYTAMLPVAAGLLAIASAAIVATGGVLGLVGVGLYAWSKRFKTSAQGYAGARRPYQTSEEPDFFKELTKGFGKVLEIDEIAKMINEAVILTQDIFGTTLPEAFKKFMLNVDMGVMRTIMKLFTEWLPDASSGLAKWGSSLFSQIGEGSLSRLNKFFKYLAQGLQNTAKWLADTGFAQLDGLTSILGQAISQLMTLGKVVLPILVDVLKSVYPMPLKPIISTITALFDAIAKSQTAMGVLKALTGLFIVLGTISLTESFIIALIVGLKLVFAILATAIGALMSPIALIVISILALTAALLWLSTKSEIVKDALTALGTLIINEFIFIYNVVAKWIGNLKNLFSWMMGSDERVDYSKPYRELKYNTGENIYSPLVSEDYRRTQQEQKINITVDDNQFGIGVLDTLSGTINGTRGGVRNV